jgi:hypothetical protein
MGSKVIFEIYQRSALDYAKKVLTACSNYNTDQLYHRLTLLEHKVDRFLYTQAGHNPHITDIHGEDRLARFELLRKEYKELMVSLIHLDIGKIRKCDMRTIRVYLNMCNIEKNYM